MGKTTRYKKTQKELKNLLQEGWSYVLTEAGYGRGAVLKGNIVVVGAFLNKPGPACREKPERMLDPSWYSPTLVCFSPGDNEPAYLGIPVDAALTIIDKIENKFKLPTGLSSAEYSVVHQSKVPLSVKLCKTWHLPENEVKEVPVPLWEGYDMWEPILAKIDGKTLLNSMKDLDITCKL